MEPATKPGRIAMGIFDSFRRRPAIREGKALADFIDENSAFLVQKAIYEYSRARAGHYSKVLFAETSFQNAVEISRWRAYPLGLVMVAEIVEGVLRNRKDRAQQSDFDALVALVLSVFDRYPAPEALGAEEWQELRGDLERRLRQISLHPVKRALEVPEQYASLYFDLMPIHEKLRGRDLETTTNYLKVALCNIHDAFTNRVEGEPLAQLTGVH
jgi:hypothetical protein